MIQLKYPFTKKQKFTDEYGEKSVEDQYNWLHKLESKPVKEWLDTQHSATDKYFNNLNSFDNRIEHLRNQEERLNIVALKHQHNQYVGVYDSPKEGLAVFTSKDLENFEVLQRAKAPYTTIFSAELSPVDSNLLLFFGYYKNETRASVNLVNLSEDKVIDRFGFGFDHLWSSDGSFIYYSKAVTAEEDSSQSVQEIYRYDVKNNSHELLHVFNDNAVVVYFDQSNEDVVVKIDVNYHDSKLLLVKPNGEVEELTEVLEVDYEYIGTIDERLYFVADEKSDQYQIVYFNKKEGFSNRVVFDNPTAYGMEAKVVSDKIVVFSKEGAQDMGAIVDKEGKFLENVDLPSEFSSVRIIGTSDETLFLNFDSVDVPPAILAYDGTKNKSESLYALDTASKADNLETKVHKVTLRDGLTSTLYLTYDKRIEVDETSPLLIYGYGGYGVSQTMSFRDPMTEYSLKSWCKKGGVYANMILRGGGEYGKSWHDSGKLDKKQTTFNDLYDLTTYLHEQNISSPSHTAIGGASNGGLLVSAAFTQRPDLFGCVIDGVGLHDMLYFVKDPRGSMYKTEYGDPYDPDMFEALKAYSPYHNVKENSDYPPIYIQAGYLDTNVPAYHAMKFAAKIQDTNPNGNPTLLRILPNGHHDTGHGEEHYLTIAERQCFVEENLKLKPMINLEKRGVR